MENRGGKGEFSTASGIPLKKIYTPDDIADLDYKRDLAFAGEAPYTRGAYPNMYREKLWRVNNIGDGGGRGGEWLRQQGQQAAFAMGPSGPSFTLYDIDDPEVASRKSDAGIIGGGVSIDETRASLKDVPLDQIYFRSLTTPQTSPFSYACVFSVVEERGIPLARLTGTGMNDMLLAYLCTPALNQVPPRHGLRLLCDTVEYCSQYVPKFMAHSFCGNDIGETGSNAYQELGMIFANAVAIIDELLKRGRQKVDDFAYMIATASLEGGSDFFEQIAKCRAVRRMWYRLIRDRYHAQEERSHKFRLHVETAGVDLTYQQPLNNIARVAYQLLASALGGVQSISCDSYDEPFAYPTEQAALIALRTQQIAQHETNIASVVDPLAGSYYVEWLTNEIEKRSWDYFDKIQAQGGFIAAIESGWLHGELMKEMWEHEARVQSGQKKVIGVNCFEMEEEPYQWPVRRSDPQAWEKRKARLDEVRKKRDSAKLEEALKEVRRVAESDENIMPAMMGAAKAHATPGDIGKVYRAVFSTWNPPFPF